MEFRIIIGLALIYQVNPWEIYDPPRGGTGPGWNYVSPPWTQPSSSVVFRRPMDAMVDLTNDLGVAILQDYSHSRSNFAFSPYGVASVLVVLYEGARGESARQIHTAVKFPWDRDITRIGFRDIHRHLRSYFSHEGYLSGITLNKDGAALKPEYKRVLRFYGYDVDVEPSMETTTRFPYTTTTTKFTQVPIVTRTTTTTTTTEAVSTQTTPKVETTTKGTTVSQMPETESPKPKEEVMTTTTAAATTITTTTTTTTSKPQTTTVKMETTPLFTESSSTEQSTEGNIGEKEPEESKPEEEVPEKKEEPEDKKEDEPEEKEPEDKKEDEPEMKEEPEDKKEDEPEMKEEPEDKKEDEPEMKDEPEDKKEDEPEMKEEPEDKKEDEPEMKEEPEDKKHDEPDEKEPEDKKDDEPDEKEPEDKKDDEPDEKEPEDKKDDEPDEKEPEEKTEDEPEMKEVPEDKAEEEPEKEKPEDEPEKEEEPVEPTEDKVEDRFEAKEEPTTEKQITIPAYTEEPTESSDEIQVTPTTTATEKSEETSNKMEPDESQSTTPNDINIDNGMLIPQPEGATPLSLHNLNTMDSQQLPLSNSSDDAESRMGIDSLMEETATRTTILTEIETTTVSTPETTTQTFEVKKRSPNTNPQHYLWEPKTLDEYLIKKRNDEIEDMTYVNPSKEISIKSLEEYLSLKSSNASREAKRLKSNIRPMKIEELLGRRRKQILSDNSPISFHTNVGFQHKKTFRERRTISDFLKIPPVPDLSLQLQNGMFDSHVSRGADLYRTLPRSLFLVDGAVDTPVPVMSYTSVFPFAFIPRLHSTALEFPLDDERYKLLIILPVERRGLRQLMYDLSACPLRQVLESLRPTRVKATVPTFMVEGFVILTPTLQKLGIWDVFDPRRSNLSGMSTDPELYVRNIEQSVTVVIRNYVEILDIQTRTMAARGVEQEFTATHPFLYFVLDTETNVALMAGQILDPLNSRIY